MAYDEFFTDGDKPYAENLNDSLLLMDAFNVTVPCEMPTMFNNGEFSSTANVARKCGIGIVTLKSASGGVTIGTNSITGTGDVVFRVYPNFNSFYKWQSIIVTKSAGTVAVSFKKTDGTSISATVGNDGVISEASALKELQEIDVVLTLTSATISKILINFVNNQGSHTRTGALLNADQLTNVNGSITSGNTKAVNGGTVYTALTAKEDKSNKVTSLDNSDAHYPSAKAVKTAVDGKANASHTHSTSDITGLINLIYPVGSIYMSVNDVDPSTLFGGTWARIKDRFLLGKGDTYTTNGATGGESEHTLAVNEMPSHTHIQNAHSHNAPVHDQQSPGVWKFLTSDGDIKVNGPPRGWPKANCETDSDVHYVYGSTAGVTVPGIEEDATTANTTATNKNTGGDQAHNNMPPYLVVNIWKRTA